MTQDELLRNITDPATKGDILSYPVRTSFVAFENDALFLDPPQFEDNYEPKETSGAVVAASTHGYILSELDTLEQPHLGEKPATKKQVQMAFRTEPV